METTPLMARTRLSTSLNDVPQDDAAVLINKVLGWVFDIHVNQGLHLPGFE